MYFYACLEAILDGIFLLSAFLQNFFLHQDHLSGDMPPHSAQPCYVALVQALIWGLYPDWLRALAIGFPLPRLGPAVDHDGVTATRRPYNPERSISKPKRDLNLGP